MKTIRNLSLGLIVTLLLVIAAGCVTETPSNSNSSSPSPSVSPSPTATERSAVDVPVTLPVLDALLSDEAFRAKAKSQVALSDAEIAQLQKIAGEEVSKLRQANAEDQIGSAEESRQHAAEAIRGAVGEEKAKQLFALAQEYWVKGSDEPTADKSADTAKAAGPNAVPKDTRVVVNIPAYRMDVFREGELVKSYKIGIGYPEFPLPTGMRKAQSIIFNPTWTPPDEPWVAKMKNVSVGEKVEAGSKLNPLGPIKIPIGLPSLIHGGKSVAKLGTFASHGCVGLTTPQVQDFAKLLAQTSGTELSDVNIQANLKDKTQTKTVKLGHAVPVELRYETIVAEDGKLHIYKDVYDQNSNTEENLRAVLQANGVGMEDLTEAERTQVLSALNAMSVHPQNEPAAKSPATVPPPTSGASPSTNKTEKKAAVAKAKPLAKNQKEVVIEIAALKGKGYPVAVNLDTGAGKPPALLAKKV
ncbi:MAG: L,D-transpeptidase ErfK/SrfK [Pyrinomonadaceae bacterium]|jgi:lipoprotein-anchoring transpeptidase ErfK/SrfK|nr:L,D-transpeptidase ErfK/SrfK [Pyrinomonadaceae bacterium]